MRFLLVTILMCLSIVGVLGQTLKDASQILEQEELSDTAKISRIFNLAKLSYDEGELKETVSILTQLNPIIESSTTIQLGNFNNLLGSSFLRLGYPDSAQYYLRSTVDRLPSDIYPDEYAYAVSFLAMIEEDRGNLSESVLLYKEAIDIMEMSNDSFRWAATINNLGMVLDKRGELMAALDHYYRALALFAALKVDRALPSITANIGKVHYSLENDEEALSYFKLSLKHGIELNSLRSQANALNDIGAIYLDQKLLDSAEVYLVKCLSISEKLENKDKMSTVKNNLSKIYKFRNEYDRAIQLNKEALSHARNVKIKRPEIFALYELGENYHLKSDRATALGYYNKALSLANEIGEIYLIYQIHNALYKSHKDVNVNKALYHLEHVRANRDSIINKENLKTITQKEMQYAFEKENLLKEKKLDEMEAAAKINSLQVKQQRSLILILLLLSSLAISALVMYLQKSKSQKELAVQKNIIQKSEIEQLKKEKKVLTMNAMIEGQEAERSRIAKDLHDGLGGLLSTVKAHFSNIQSEIQKIEKINVYNKANELVDEACDEVRRISHNLMPGALRLEGLKTAVEHLGEEMSAAHPFSVRVESIGFNTRMEESKEVFIYRILQEALNNIIKHADASDVLVQLSETEEEYHFIVEDDGKGFDPLQIASGLGLKSIQSRVDFLKGSLDIDTKQGVGTTLSWHIPKS